MVAQEQDRNERVARRAVITGHVQGVIFCASARREAQALGVTGWVRNRADERVEVSAEGEQAAVQALPAWCRQGPPRARVERVLVEDGKPAWHDTLQVR